MLEIVIVLPPRFGRYDRDLSVDTRRYMPPLE